MKPTPQATYPGIALVPEERARVDGELLKETRSYCPTCMRVLDARVYAVDGLVWLFKQCPDHGPYQGLVEKDVELYRQVMNPGVAPELPYFSLIIPITHSCNLDCSICFLPDRDRENLTRAQIGQVLDETEISWIVLSGGEPTLRADLPELLQDICQRDKVAGLNSNGIKLADRDYTRRLADAGLNSVVLAFNGADDAIYQRINGRPLLEQKRRALENLVEAGISVLVSPTIMRGINEDLTPLLKLCNEYWPDVYQLRMRGAARVGVHGDFDPLVLSELVELVARPLGRTLPQLLGEFDPARCHHAATQWILEGQFYASGERAGQLHSWDEGTLYLHHPEAQNLGGSWVGDRPLSQRYAPFGFHIWAWPDRFNVDLEEIKSTGVSHLYGERTILSFYDAILRAHEL